MLLIICVTMVGCIGLKPNPRYTNENKYTKAQKSSKKVNVKKLVKVSSNEGRYLIQQIENYLGVRYKWGGTTNAGMDCSGFVKTVFENSIDLELPHNAGQLFNVGKKTEENALAFGDLVFFKNVGARGISHVGIYLADSNFVHASTKRGVVVSNIKSKYYKQRYVAAKRIYKF